MLYSGQERRKDLRISSNFSVSYRLLHEDGRLDLTQTKNICLGGMLLTTNRKFAPNTRLAIEIRLPFDQFPFSLTGKVIESREITKDLIYDTRLEFTAIDQRHKKIISQTVEGYTEKKS